MTKRFRNLRIFGILISLCLLSQLALADVVEFNACNPVALKQGTVTTRALGMYNISPSGYFERYTASNGMNSQCGGALGGNVYYEFKTNVMTNPTLGMIQKWNYPAWSRNGAPVTCPKVNMFAQDVAYNPVDKLIYGCFWKADKSGWELGTVDPTAFSSNYNRPTIAELPSILTGMAFTPDGKLYAVDMEGVLYSIATDSGAMTKIGATGFVPNKSGSATIDDKTGEMYWVAVCEKGSYLCKVDRETGKATKLLDLPYGEQLKGLHIYRPSVPAAAPGYASDVKFNFEKATHNGTVSFTMPSTTFDGAKGVGDATYTVTIAGSTVATGTAAFGAQVKDIPVEAAADGAQLATVVISNTAGSGPAHKIEVFVGAGIPNSPASVTAQYFQGEFNVNWDAVTTSSNNCYIDPAEVTYTVTRLPDNVVVLKDSKELSLKDGVAIPAEPTTYSYSVTASYAGKTSTAAVSSGIRLGALTPPYINNFDKEENISEFTIINSNNDVFKWTWTKDGMAVPASNSLDMNDWLITPPFLMKKGYAYQLSADAQGMYTNVNEKFEVKMGSSPTAEAMNIDVLAPKTVIYGSEPSQVLITPEEDGMYYIGIHAISPSGSGALYLKSVEVGEELLLTAPQAVSDLNAVPASDDSNKVTVSFKAPEKSIDGAVITSLEKIDLYRGETVIKTFQTPGVGATLSFEDDATKSGDVEYVVVPFNSFGKGQKAVKSVYAGVNYPAAPKNVSAIENESAGEVEITWTAPGKDIAGFDMNDNLVTYDLYSSVAGTRDLIAENLTATRYVHKAFKPGDEQRFVQYTVMAKSVRGEGSAQATELLPVGTSYTLPFNESFSYGTLSHIMGSDVLIGNSQNVQWLQCTTGDINKYEPADDDNGFIAHYAKYTGQSGRIFTGKIKIDASHPIMWFSTYCITDSHNGKIRIFVKDNGEWKETKAFVVNEVANKTVGWHRAMVDLSAYAGKTVQIGLAGETHGYAHILLDDIRIFDAKDYDLAIEKVNAPLTVEAGTEQKFSVNVINNGVADIANHKLAVKFNGKKIDEVEGDALSSGKVKVHEFTYQLPLEMDQTNTFQVEVINDKDQLSSNNASPLFTLNVAKGSLPAVKNLTATSGDGVTVVNWDAPDNVGTPVVRNNVEGMKSWTNQDGEWTFVDVDNAPITGITGLALPGVDVNSKQSWWVMDNTLEAISQEYDFKAHSGNKFLASMARYDAGTADDWAISPMLSNGGTVGFFARSFHGRFPESFEVLYSKKSTNTSDFVSLTKVENVPYNWTEYSYILPEDAVYFAIRHTTKGGFMLYLDDLTYTPACGSGKDIKLKGYHVVADNVQKTDKAISTTTYSIEGRPTIVKVYPIFEEGVGSASETSVKSGVANIAESALSIAGGSGEIIITGAESLQVNIVTPGGIVIFSGDGNEQMHISAVPGLYIVKAGNYTKKVTVK